MITGVIYDVATGVGLRTVRASSQALLALQAGDGEAVHEGEFDMDVLYLDPDDDYALIARPLMGCHINKSAIYANGTDQIVISDLPVGATVVHPEGLFVVEDGDTSLTWACIVVGEYDFQIMLDPYQTVYYTVNVLEKP